MTRVVGLEQTQALKPKPAAILDSSSMNSFAARPALSAEISRREALTILIVQPT
jgi:hypothetical protein